MELQLHSHLHGFTVEKITALPDIDATGYQLVHEVSGARVFYVACADDNKVFTIGFRTPSQDDTGVAHITEHSVLCGSRKYRLKEPFVELVKGSLNTFLNAMTYSDKTVYPVASRNDKDFRNLVDVYLDAVFYPLTSENPFTLKQEGWHYELGEGEDKPLIYNGVVYNEMKGVYSSPDAIEEHEVCKALFPDSPYRFESGGLPEAIPELTQEGFIAFHKKYYSPENSYIYLYGNMDIEDYLAYLDTFKWLMKLAADGDIRAQFLAGSSYLTGNGVKADPAEAVRWFEKAAQQGSVDAQTSLVLYYLGNEPVRLDEARSWAAKLENQTGSRGVGAVFRRFFTEMGEWPEPERTHERIKDWFDSLFSTKDPDLLYGLGFLYELGYQGQRDMDKALALYKRAAALGNVNAIKKLKELQSVF